MTKPPDNFPSSSPWQFGLRWFLLATAAVAGFMAWWTYQVRDLRQRREATEKIVQWQNEAISPDNFWIPDLRELTTPPVAWWLALSGEETYPLLTSLSFDVRSYDDAFVESSPIDDSHLPTIALATTLKTLKIPRAKITDAGLAALASLQELVSLDLEDTPITEEGFRNLAKLLSLS